MTTPRHEQVRPYEPHDLSMSGHLAGLLADAMIAAAGDMRPERGYQLRGPDGRTSSVSTAHEARTLLLQGYEITCPYSLTVTLDDTGPHGEPGTALGRSLHAMRTGLGLSLGELANATSMSPAYLARVEAGKATPTAGWFALVAAEASRQAYARKMGVRG